ncbi:hypothetical protein [Anoxynatronum buryatiense]|uniref:Uncharacterized protein n=1 Tax=Anoxynatronum buryatiense TaxID=489973 RepID=A0AA45WXB0_9CLOT|nr:hypothetical protein [Anoxynatronum buryatiense]SMP63521.1 hypothetical protein SAMN06296020_11140 [Anoxynatronum buryatiense]
MNSIIHKETQMTIALRQTRDKLYHNANAFMYLIILQLLGYFLANNVGMSGSGTEYFSYTVRIASSVPLIFFTIIWMLLQGLHLAGEKSREYYLVSNNFTAYFSDIAVLEIFAVTGGVTLLLSESFLQVMVSVLYENVTLQASFSEVGFINYVSLFVTATLYLLMFGAAAYTVGILRARFKGRFFLGIFLLIALLIFGSVLAARLLGPAFGSTIESAVNFYLHETRGMIWFLKMAVTIGALYGISYLGIRNLEVNA